MKMIAKIAGSVLAGVMLIGAGPDRTVLPVPELEFDGEIAENVMDSKPGSHHTVRAPEGAPMS